MSGGLLQPPSGAILASWEPRPRCRPICSSSWLFLTHPQHRRVSHPPDCRAETGGGGRLLQASGWGLGGAHSGEDVVERENYSLLCLPPHFQAGDDGRCFSSPFSSGIGWSPRTCCSR